MSPRKNCRLAAASTTVVSIAVLSGCAAFNPYQRSERLHNDLLPVSGAASAANAAAAGVSVSWSGPASAPSTAASAALLRIAMATQVAQAAPNLLAGDLPGALEAVADQRNEWFGALSSHARTLNSASKHR